MQKQDLNIRIFVVVSAAAQSASDDRRKQVQFRKQNLSSEKSYFSVFLVCSASHRWRRRRWQLPTSTSIRCLWNPEPVKSCEASQFSLGFQYYQLLAQWTTPSNRTLHWSNYLRWRKSSFDKWTLFLRSEKKTRKWFRLPYCNFCLYLLSLARECRGFCNRCQYVNIRNFWTDAFMH